MKQLLFVSVIVGTVILTGCASQKYVRSDLKSKMGMVKPTYKERDIQKNLEKEVNLPKPFSVAVFFQEPQNSSSAKAAWRWTLKDKEDFIKKLRESVDPSIVKQVFLMSDFSDDFDLYDVRLAASKYGADSVLVVQAATDTVRQPTKWVSSYALVLPLFFINGTQAQSYFSINASLWDVRNEMLYLSTSSEGELTEAYPLAWPKPDSEYIQKTKDIALNRLIQAVPQDFSAFKPQEITQ